MEAFHSIIIIIIIKTTSPHFLHSPHIPSTQLENTFLRLRANSFHLCQPKRQGRGIDRKTKVPKKRMNPLLCNKLIINYPTLLTHFSQTARAKPLVAPWLINHPHSPDHNQLHQASCICRIPPSLRARVNLQAWHQLQHATPGSPRPSAWGKPIMNIIIALQARLSRPLCYKWHRCSGYVRLMLLGPCALQTRSSHNLLTEPALVQNLGGISLKLRALDSSKSSSAWTLAAHVAAAVGLEMQDRMGLLLLTTSTWTENIEYTGLWSENLDSPLKYHSCFSPSPFHNILSHLSSKTLSFFRLNCQLANANPGYRYITKFQDPGKLRKMPFGLTTKSECYFDAVLSSII